MPFYLWAHAFWIQVCIRALSLSTINIWAKWFFVGRTVLFIRQCLAASLSSHTRCRSHPSPYVVINKNVFRHYQMSPEGAEELVMRMKSHGPGRREYSCSGGRASPWGKHIELFSQLSNEANPRVQPTPGQPNQEYMFTLSGMCVVSGTGS